MRRSSASSRSVCGARRGGTGGGRRKTHHDEDEGPLHGALHVRGRAGGVLRRLADAREGLGRVGDADGSELGECRPLRVVAGDAVGPGGLGGEGGHTAFNSDRRGRCGGRRGGGRRGRAVGSPARIRDAAEAAVTNRSRSISTARCPALALRHAYAKVRGGWVRENIRRGRGRRRGIGAVFRDRGPARGGPRYRRTCSFDRHATTGAPAAPPMLRYTSSAPSTHGGRARAQAAMTDTAFPTVA